MKKLFGIAVAVALAGTSTASAQFYPQGQQVYPQGQFVPQGQMIVDGVGGEEIPYAESYGGGGNEELYPYDQQDTWLHGYFQEIPAYGGYSHFRPYNYKHVLAQTQAAAGWGLSRTMPYSHQYWERYHERASLQHCPLPYHAYDDYKNEPVGYRVPANAQQSPQQYAPRR